MFRELFQGLVNVHYDELSRMKRELQNQSKKKKQ